MVFQSFRTDLISFLPGHPTPFGEQEAWRPQPEVASAGFAVRDFVVHPKLLILWKSCFCRRLALLPAGRESGHQYSPLASSLGLWFTCTTHHKMP